VPDLTGEAVSPIGGAGGPPAHSGFDAALRGYDRRQVDRYVARAQRHIDRLTAQLAVMNRRERDLTARVDELAEAIARCTCGPESPPSAILGARLRQILDLALAEAADVRAHAQADSQALHQEADQVLAQARAQAERAAADVEAGVAHRRAAETAAEAERWAAVDNWADDRVGEARETARRLIESAAAVSGQVVASARWLVDALGAHRDALSEQLGGVSRRIEALPSLEPPSVAGPPASVAGPPSGAVEPAGAVEPPAGAESPGAVAPAGPARLARAVVRAAATAAGTPGAADGGPTAGPPGRLHPAGGAP
jgi:cell division septum initiation protein DivIVA